MNELKIIDKNIYFEEKDLYELWKPETFKIARKRNSNSFEFLKNPERKEGESMYLVKYDSLSEDKKALITSTLCNGVNPYELQRYNIIKTYLESKPVDVDYILNYRYNGCYLEEEKQNEYIEACKYLYFLERYSLRPIIIKKSFPFIDSIPTFWNIITTLIKQNKVRLPLNYSKLTVKRNEYLQIGAGCVITGKIANTNSAKIKTEEQKALLIELRGHHNNFDFAQIANAYNEAARVKNWKTITRATVYNHFMNSGELEAVTLPGRRGVKEYKNTLSVQVKRRAPEHAFYFLTVDGWVAELLFQETVTDKKGHQKTTHHNRLTIVVILDAMNKFPVGYAIDRHEDTELIKHAVKNAVDYVYSITGKYYLPWQMQSDNFSKKEMTPFYEKVAHYYTPAAVGNAKSKIIEPYFNYFNKNYAQYQSNWSGFGITSSKDNQPNREWLDVHKNQFPDEAYVRTQLENFIAKERAAKYNDWMRSFNSAETEKREIDRMRYLELFGTLHSHTNQLHAVGLEPTLEGVTRCYDLLDMDFRNLAHLDWHTVYDSNDMSSILVTAEEGKYKYVLPQKHIQPMSLKERAEGDAAELQKIRDFNKEREAAIIEKRRETGEIVEDMINNTPALRETIQKLMPTERGQQKTLQQKALGLGENKGDRFDKTAEVITVKKDTSTCEEDEDIFNDKF